MILNAVCRYLAEVAGVGAYDPSGAPMTADWSLWPEGLPAEPAKAIGVTVYAGAAEPDPGQPWADVRVQFRARGSADPRESRARLVDVYNALHGLESVLLPGGVWLQTAAALQPEPVGLGPDQSGRHEHVLNIEFSYDQPSQHRPALEG